MLDLSIHDPPLAAVAGRGVRIAVIDSGIHPGHPHVGGVVEAIAIDDQGNFHDDVIDRLGHGTAVAAAIHEKAPSADIHIIKVFHDSLSTNLEALLLALDHAAERGADLINLSLGTANPDHRAELKQALGRIRAAGSILVSAAEHDGRSWYPGCLEGAFGVHLDSSCPRDALRLDPASEAAAASGFARPIPGVPPERNLNGVSFSVANATGVLARLLEWRRSADAHGKHPA